MEISKLKFKEIAKEWLISREREVKKTTFYRYESMVQNRLIPYFENQFIVDMNNEMLIDYFRAIETEYKYHTMVSIFNVLRSILIFAGKRDAITCEFSL